MDPTDERRGADEDPPPALEPAGRSRRRKARGGLGETIGNAIVGFDHQIFRATKPPAILVESAKPVRGVSGEGGRMLSIEFPDDAPAAGPPGAEEDRPAAG